MRVIHAAGIAVIVLVVLGGVFLLHRGGEGSELVVFHAGSLTGLVDSMKEPLREEGIEVLNEPSGSVMVARKIIDLGKRCDVAMFADYRLIPEMLFPAGKADWAVLFASNEMVLVYTDKSRGAGEISSDNWLQVILRPGVRIGFSNPNMDPAGYRAVMVLGLASIYYSTDEPLRLLEQGANITRVAGEGLVLDATGIAPDSKKIFVRDKSVDLIALVEQGIIDYAFEYRNVAVSHGLKYVELPPRLSLADPALDDRYSQVSVKIRGAGGETKTLTAKSITYGATIPTTAQHAEAAKIFLQLLLGPKGREFLTETGFKPLDQPKLVVREGASPPDWLLRFTGP